MGRKLPIVLGPALLLVVGAGVWIGRDRSPEPRPASPLKAFHRKDRTAILEEFRRSLRKDPTLAPAILSLTRADVLEMKHLSPEDREAYWEHVQALQAEARKVPVEPLFEVSD